MITDTCQEGFVGSVESGKCLIIGFLQEIKTWFAALFDFCGETNRTKTALLNIGLESDMHNQTALGSQCQPVSKCHC